MSTHCDGMKLPVKRFCPGNLLTRLTHSPLSTRSDGSEVWILESIGTSRRGFAKGIRSSILPFDRSLFTSFCYITTVNWLFHRELLDRLRQQSHKHWRQGLRLRERLHFSEDAFHLFLAGGIGVIGGLVNLLASHSTELIKTVFLGRAGDLVEAAEIMPPLERLLIPMLGGLGAGLTLFWGLRLVGPQRSGNLLEVVVAGDGRLPFRTAIVKFLSSLISIGTGASIGREGAITQLSATIASKIGQVALWHPYRLRLLVGCGAAAGISAAYNAPISGAVFAAWIVLGNFSMHMFAPLVFASVVSTMVSRSFFGLQTWYHVPPFEFTSITQLPWFLVLGLISGMAGALFLKLLSRTESGFLSLKIPIPVRLALGGLLVGIIAWKYPEVWGNGYVVTNRILQNDYPEGLNGAYYLTGLLVAKGGATLITVGSGAVGGVFTPTLFLGAALGASFGLLLQHLGFGMNLPVLTFAMVGMGGMLASTIRSPLLAMIMIFEISMDYSLMPPLMLACVVSSLMSRRWHAGSIYTDPLRQKGLQVPTDPTGSDSPSARTVGEVMLAPVPPLRENTQFQEIAERFLGSSNNFLPVVDEHNQLVGMVALQDLKEHLGQGESIPGVIAHDVMRPAPVPVTPGQRLIEILPAVLASEQRNIPVVNNLKENKLVGALLRSEVLTIFSEVIDSTSKTEE